MLVRCLEDQLKIAMGLLSFISDFKDFDRLNQLCDSYQKSADRALYLWKDEETDNFIGVVGVEFTDDDVLVRHIAVNPSFRHEGIAHKMLDAVHHINQKKSLMGTLELTSILAHWEGSSKSDDKQLGSDGN